MHISTLRSKCWQQKIFVFAENDDAFKWVAAAIGFIVYGNGVGLKLLFAPWNFSVVGSVNWEL